MFYWTTCLSYVRYKALDVKNILTETVSHHILRQMLESPMWVDLNNLLQDYLKFMDDHLKESADLTFLAYRHRNYSKVNNLNSSPLPYLPVYIWLLSWLIWIIQSQVIEFVLFKQRLQQSNQYEAARVEASLLQLKQNADSIEEEEVTNTIPLSCKLPYVHLFDPLIIISNSACILVVSSAFLKTWNLEFSLWSSRTKWDQGHWGSMKICKHDHGGHLVLRKTIY